jgi:nicotinate-nucleotide pyrophosphorylase (carboxylating)
LDLIRIALREDLSDAGDITSKATIPTDKKIAATMRARENGILAGLDVAIQVFKEVDVTLTLTLKAKDGDTLKAGQDILIIEGNAQKILTAERTALNVMTHLSGIATQTAKYVEAVKGTDAQILDTRKTLPGYRMLQKHAVKMGGGKNHRMGLYDAILIKDNHIASAGGISQALNAAKATNKNIQIEVDTLEQLQEVLDNGNANGVLLDNMTPEKLKQAVSLVNKRLTTEASGGINLDTVRAIAETGVDYVSVGALTHSVKTLDIGLDIKD